MYVGAKVGVYMYVVKIGMYMRSPTYVFLDGYINDTMHLQKNLYRVNDEHSKVISHLEYVYEACV